MSQPIYTVRDRTDQLWIAQRYAKRPQDGLVIRIEQATTATGHDVVLTPAQVADLRNTLSDWLDDRAHPDALACAAAIPEQSMHDGQAPIDAAVNRTVTDERARIARDLELVEEFCKDYTFETGEVLIPRDVAVEIARSGTGPTRPCRTGER